MDDIDGLLSLVTCGRCQTTLFSSSVTNGVQIYWCQCSLKRRALLTCNYCQKLFLNFPYLIRETNYCSQECYWVGTNKKKVKICKVCGKEFNIKAYLVEQGYGFYCSKACWFALFKKLKINVKCQQCNKEFLVIRAVYKKHPKFCSKTCKDVAETDQISSVCKGCKVIFNLPRSAIDRGRGLFCTWECYKKYKGESSLEELIRLQLEKLNEPFQQEMKVGKFRADFFLPKKNLIIECDGEYWHMNKKNRLRDRRKDALLGQLGYNILRLKGQEIINRDFDLESLLLEK